MGVMSRGLAPLNTVLEHGYFFDDFYEKIVARGVQGVASGIRLVEARFFARLPRFTAKEVMMFARGTHKYLDVLIDRMMYTAAGRTLTYSNKARKLHDESLQRTIAAALIGLLIIAVIVVITSM